MGLVAARISSPWRRNQRETTSGHPVGPTVASRIGITAASRKSSTSLGAKGPRRLATSTPARLGRPLRGGRIRHDLTDLLTAGHGAVKEKVEDSPVSTRPRSLRAWSRPSSVSTSAMRSATPPPSRASLSAHAATGRSGWRARVCWGSDQGAGREIRGRQISCCARRTSPAPSITADIHPATPAASSGPAPSSRTMTTRLTGSSS